MTRFTRILAATAIVALSIAPAVAQKAPQAQIMLEAAKQKEMLQGDLDGAIKQYQAIVDQFGKTDRAAAARALLAMAECYQKQGDAKARSTLERIVREFGDQAVAAEARVRLTADAHDGAPTVPFASRLVCTACAGELPSVGITPDGQSYCHDYVRFLSELFVVEGLK